MFGTVLCGIVFDYCSVNFVVIVLYILVCPVLGESNTANLSHTIHIYGMFTYIWLIYMVNAIRVSVLY